MAMLEFTDDKSTRTVAFPKVTIEVALYVALALVGLSVRLLVLGDAPLSSDEARQALASWNFFNGKPDAFTGSPLQDPVAAGHRGRNQPGRSTSFLQITGSGRGGHDKGGYGRRRTRYKGCN